MLEKLTKQKYRNKIGIAIVIVAILGISYFGGMARMVSVYLVTDYGDVRLYQSATDTEISNGDLLNVQNGDYITVWLLDDVSTSRKPIDEDFNVALYLGSAGSSGT